MNEVKRLLVRVKNPNPYIPSPGDWFVWRNDGCSEWGDVMACIKQVHGRGALGHTENTSCNYLYAVSQGGYVEFFLNEGEGEVEFAQVVPAHSEHLEFKLKG